MTPPLIAMQHIVKVFPPDVVALDDVSMPFRQGEIHAIVGENGAGKTTLMNILYGMLPADQGQIHYRGEPVNFHDPGQAIEAGIGMVHQEILLVNEYSIWQNVVLGVEPVSWLGRVDEKSARKRVRQRIAEYRFNLDPDAIVSEISVAARQKVEILKLLYRDVSVLILDEPTAVLTPQEIPQLFSELRRLRDDGHTILFISHHLDEVVDLSDRVTVLRRGRKIDTVLTESTSKSELARMMVGREVLFSSLREPKPPGKPVFTIRGLSFRDNQGRQRLQGVNLEVREGEIVGIAGVEGNGQLALVNTIMGLEKPTEGEILAKGRPLQDLPILERRKSIAFVSQDRSRMSASLSASITDNTIMTHHRLNPRLTSWQGRLLERQEARQFTAEIEKDFAVSMGSQDNLFRSLSGGNQQKVILGRELTLDTPILLLDQPTRGLDVGSIEYVHRQILAMRDNGRGILLLSADLDELFRIADRILVLHRGRIVGDLTAEETTIEEVGYLMLEGKRHHEDE